MTEQKAEKEVKKIRVSTQLYPDEKKYLQWVANKNERSMSGQLRITLLQSIPDDDENDDDD